MFETLQTANFVTPLLLDDDEGLRATLRKLDEVDAATGSSTCSTAPR